MARTTKSRTPSPAPHEGPNGATEAPEATGAHPTPTEAPDGPTAGHGDTAPEAPAPTPKHIPPEDALHAVTFGETRPIGALKLAEYNPRVMSPEMMDRLMRSISQYGFMEPVVIRPEDNLVAGGHQRVEALRRLLLSRGVSPAEINATPVPVAVLPRGCSDVVMMSINQGLNRIVGSWDFSKLNDVLQQVYAASVEGLVDFETTGFVPADLDDLSKQLAAIHYVPGTYGAEAGARSAARGGFGGGGKDDAPTAGTDTPGTGSPGADDPDAALAAYLSGGTPADGSAAPNSGTDGADPASHDTAGVARAGGGIPESLQGCDYDGPTVSGVLRAAVARHGAGSVVAVEFPAEAAHLAEHARDCLGALSRGLKCTPAEALYGALIAMLAASGIEVPPEPPLFTRATLGPVDGGDGAAEGEAPEADDAPGYELPEADGTDDDTGE